jgi:hypothetical protein
MVVLVLSAQLSVGTDQAGMGAAVRNIWACRNGEQLICGGGRARMVPVAHAQWQGGGGGRKES